MGTTACMSNQLQYDESMDVAKRPPTPKQDEAKMLFLGSAGSGKTTFCKQLHKIHCPTSFQTAARKRYLPYIFEQCIGQMRVALDAIEKRMSLLRGYCRESGYDLTRTLGDDILAQILTFQFGTARLSPSGIKAAKVVFQTNFSVDTLTDSEMEQMVCYPETYDEIAALEILWGEPMIKEMYGIRSSINLEESSAYFWNKVHVLKEVDLLHMTYVPDLDDIMRLSRATTGIQVRDYTNPDSTHSSDSGEFRVIHVGGLQSEREHWKGYLRDHCEGLSALVFVASLSCYDELMVEDPQKNRMTDQLELFRQVLNEDIVRDIPIILLLTKKDLFLEKIKRVSLSQCDAFASHDSPGSSYWNRLGMIQNAFWSAAQWGGSWNEQRQNRKLLIRFVNALDAAEVGRVWKEVWRYVVKGEDVPLIDPEPQQMDDLYRHLADMYTYGDSGLGS